jgi:mobilization protein NikA
VDTIARVKRRKPKAERKELMIPVRVTAMQKKLLTEKARRRGLPLSTWLVMLGLEAPDKAGRS